MADFRKWLLAFAVVALLSSLAVPAYGQGTPLNCVANAGVPPIIRAEGVAEQVGDVVITCTGGTPTPLGQAIPQINIQVTTTANVTSRLVGGSFNEALILMDEPHSTVNPATQLLPCTAPPCTVLGKGVFVPTPNVYGGPYNGGEGGYNVFQGVYNSALPNSVTWLGVPFDPPGTTGTRTVRITNIRVNAASLGVSNSPIPNPITEFITINGTTSVPIGNPQLTVATIQRGLTTTGVTPASTLVQCVSKNEDLFGDNTSTGSPVFLVTFNEGFASSWKVKNISQIIEGSINSPIASLQWNQDVPGYIYNSESGFYVGGTEPNPNPPTGSANVNGQVADFPSTHGLNAAGDATQGTRLYVKFGSVPQGTALFVPTLAAIYDPITNTQTGIASLVRSADANGAGGSVLASGTTGNISNGWESVPYAPVSVSSGAGFVVYEVLYTSQFNVEAMDVPVVVAYAANTGNNLPQPNIQSTVTTGFAPISQDPLASATAPVPRFVSAYTANTFIINLCNCNILFPFVTNQLGYDTGIAISNTSMDPFGGNNQQSGNVTLYYYGGTGPGGTGTAPAAQKTNAVVPPGQQLLFSIGGGGNYGIQATPNFQGYIIAQSEFQYCHAFAYINAFGNGPKDQGASEGYLGIVLDQPFGPNGWINRTGNFGEMQGH